MEELSFRFTDIICIMDRELLHHKNKNVRFPVKWRKQMNMNGFWYESKSQDTYTSYRVTGAPMLGTYVDYRITYAEHWVTGQFIQRQ